MINWTFPRKSLLDVTGGKRAIEKKLLSPPPSFFARFENYEMNISSLSSWWKLGVKEQQEKIKEYDETTKDLDTIFVFQKNIDLMLQKQSEIFQKTKLGTWTDKRTSNKQPSKKRSKAEARRVSTDNYTTHNHDDTSAGQQNQGQPTLDTGTPFKPATSCPRHYSPVAAFQDSNKGSRDENPSESNNQSAVVPYLNQIEPGHTGNEETGENNRTIMNVVTNDEIDSALRNDSEVVSEVITGNANDSNTLVSEVIGDHGNNSFSYTGVFECPPSDDESGFEIATVTKRSTKKKSSKHISNSEVVKKTNGLMRRVENFVSFTPKSNEIMYECNDIFLVQVRNVHLTSTKGGVKEIKRLEDDRHIVTITCRSHAHFIMMLKILIGSVRYRECGHARFLHYESQCVFTMKNNDAIEHQIKRIEDERERQDKREMQDEN